MAKRTLRFPFVVTVATTAAGAACGGVVFVDPAGAGGGGASGGASSSASTSGASTSTSTAASSSTGNTSNCPAAAPDGYIECDPSPGVCSYQVACQSGAVTLSFSCAEGYWQLEPTPCPQPFDSCPGTQFYCDMTWWMPLATNPPSPCPDAAPFEGSECYPGGMGGVWAHCGYHCTSGDLSSPWTIFTCENINGKSYWTYDDGTCP